MERVSPHRTCASLLVCGAFVAFNAAAAAGFPSKPVRFVVPYLPGGNTDPVARLIATKLTTAGTPASIVEQLNRDIVHAARSPDVAEKFTAQGYEIITQTTSAFATFIRTDREKIGRVAKAARIQVE